MTSLTDLYKDLYNKSLEERPLFWILCSIIQQKALWDKYFGAFIFSSKVEHLLPGFSEVFSYVDSFVLSSFNEYGILDIDLLLEIKFLEKGIKKSQVEEFILYYVDFAGNNFNSVKKDISIEDILYQ